MKYKTTIEITTDADSKEEALEIAGEFLSGNISSGVDMKYLSRPVHNNRMYVSVAAVVALVGFLFVAMVCNKPTQIMGGVFQSLNAVQPPLKTSAISANSVDFKKEWQSMHNREALNSLNNK